MAVLSNGDLAREGDIVRLVKIGRPPRGNIGYGPGYLGCYFRVMEVFAEHIRVRPLTPAEAEEEGNLPTNDGINADVVFRSWRFSLYSPTGGRGLNGLGLE